MLCSNDNLLGRMNVSSYPDNDIKHLNKYPKLLQYDDSYQSEESINSASIIEYSTNNNCNISITSSMDNCCIQRRP